MKFRRLDDGQFILQISNGIFVYFDSFEFSEHPDVTLRLGREITAFFIGDQAEALRRLWRQFNQTEHMKTAITYLGALS